VVGSHGRHESAISAVSSGFLTIRDPVEESSQAAGPSSTGSYSFAHVSKRSQADLPFSHRLTEGAASSYPGGNGYLRWFRRGRPLMDTPSFRATRAMAQISAIISVKGSRPGGLRSPRDEHERHVGCFRPGQVLASYWIVSGLAIQAISRRAFLLSSAIITSVFMRRFYPTSIHDVVRPAQPCGALDDLAEVGVDAPIGAAKDESGLGYQAQDSCERDRDCNGVPSY
jgi:hypothetical protein